MDASKPSRKKGWNIAQNSGRRVCLERNMHFEWGLKRTRLDIYIYIVMIILIKKRCCLAIAGLKSPTKPSLSWAFERPARAYRPISVAKAPIKAGSSESMGSTASWQVFQKKLQLSLSSQNFSFASAQNRIPLGKKRLWGSSLKPSSNGTLDQVIILYSHFFEAGHHLLLQASCRVTPGASWDETQKHPKKNNVPSKKTNNELYLICNIRMIGIIFLMFTLGSVSDFW